MSRLPKYTTHCSISILGRLEQYSTARHQAGFYLNVAVSATYTLPVDFTLAFKDYVYRACAVLIAGHPVLSAIPAADDTQQPYFVRLPQINLDEVVSFQQRQANSTDVDSDGEPLPDLDLQAVLQTQHNTSFLAPKPYWRLVVLLDDSNQRQFTAAFVFHHAIGDGTSGKAFHEGFLHALHTAGDSETKTIIKSPTSPLLPNIESLHPMPLSLIFLAKKLIQAKIYSPREPGLWTGGRIQAPANTQIRLVPFSRTLTASLREKCRQENSTITAFLQTAVARSLFANLPSNCTRLACAGVISCRRWLPEIITDDSMGVFVQDFEETYTRANIASSDHSLWDEARRSRETIQSALNRHGKDSGPNLLRFVSDFQQELCYSKVGRDREKSFEVSNIGVLRSRTDGHDDGPAQPRILGMVFSQCASAIGSAVGVSVVTGGDGCLVLGISWQDGVVDGGLIDSMIRSLRDELHGLAA